MFLGNRHLERSYVDKLFMRVMRLCVGGEGVLIEFREMRS